MIKLLSTPDKMIPAMKILRDTYKVGLGTAKIMLQSAPVELPLMDSYEESKLRRKLLDVGCELEKTPGDYRHVRIPASRGSSIMYCGSLEFVSACGGVQGHDIPRVSRTMEPELMLSVISRVNCPLCLEALREERYI